MSDRRPSDGKGFTLLELIGVLVLVGFLAAVGVSRYRNLNADAVSDGEILKDTLRYVRSRAISDIYTWQLQVAGQTGTIQRNSPVAQTITVSFATTGVASGTTTFDNRGQPSGTLSYAVAYYPGSPVTITPVTGYVP